MNKYNRQTVGANLALEYKGNGLLYYDSRFGKTNVVKTMIRTGIYKNILVIVPNDSIKRHWEHYLKDATDIATVTIQLALRIIKKEIMDDFDLIILDRVDKYLTPETKCLMTPDFYENRVKIIGLLDMMPVGDKKNELLKHLPIIDTIGEPEAISEGWISKFTEYNLALEFPENSKDKYRQLSETIRTMMEVFRNVKGDITVQGVPLFKSDMDVIFGCNGGVLYQGRHFTGEEVRNALAKKKGWSLNIQSSDSSYAEVLDKFWNPVAIKDNAVAFSRAVQARNKLMIDNYIKRNAVVDILKKFDRPTIIYNENIEFAENVALNIEQFRPGKVCVYHTNLQSRYLLDFNTGDYIRSKNGNPKVFGTTTLKRLAIEGLKTGKYRILSTVKALDEGIDVPELSLVIITAGSINPLQQQQRAGKVKTIDLMDINKNPIIINLYFKDFILDGEYVRSRDLSKLIVRQSEYKSEPIWITDISEIE